MGGATRRIRPEHRKDHISIHAPRGGSDDEVLHFSSVRNISIHAPRGGSDLRFFVFLLFFIYFNPRSPWGERLLHKQIKKDSSIFQSTLPVGGATIAELERELARAISIHAPRGGSDVDTSDKMRKLLISIHAPRGGSDGTEE